MPMPANASCISEWYRSTISRGVTPSFLARKVMAAPCSSLPQTHKTFRAGHAFEARSNVTGQVCASNVPNVDGAIGIGQGRCHHQSARGGEMGESLGSSKWRKEVRISGFFAIHCHLAASHCSQAMNTPDYLTKMPEPLRPGDHVMLAAPARFVTKAQVDAAIQAIEEAGFAAVMSEGLLAQQGQFGGSDAHRARVMNQGFESQEIKAIWVMRGGYGCARILPLLNQQAFSDAPTWIMGFSDATAPACVGKSPRCDDAPRACCQYIFIICGFGEAGVLEEPDDSPIRGQRVTGCRRQFERIVQFNGHALFSRFEGELAVD